MKLRTSFALVLAVATLVPPTGSASAAPNPVGGVAPPPPGSLATGIGAQAGQGFCVPGACYFRATAAQYVDTGTAASVQLSQPRPKVRPGDLHSATWMAVQSKNGRQSVLFGWFVDKRMTGDTLPHLVAQITVDGVDKCVGCGVVRTGKRLGRAVQVGTKGNYTIKFTKDRWELWYNGHAVGHVPASRWGGRFQRFGLWQVWGEVASNSPTTPRSEMGNGRLGTNPRSAIARRMRIVGKGVNSPFVYNDTEAPGKYTIGRVKPGCKTECSMNFGGPGY